MDAADFEMPSPKRQKTNSPVQEAATMSTSVPQNDTDVVNQEKVNREVEPAPLLSRPTTSGNEDAKIEGEDMLDVLMQHVESEAASKDVQLPSSTEQQPPHPTAERAGEHVELSARPEIDVNMDDLGGVALNTHPGPSVVPPNTTAEATPQSSLDQPRAVEQADGLLLASDTLASDQVPHSTEIERSAAETAAPTAEAREWETDSSPYDSDSSDTSTDSDSDDSDEDDDDDEEYTLLDPYEQARILMAEDGGGAGDDDNSDDDTRRGASRPSAGLRTLNEKPEEFVPPPNIIITDDMAIEELGSVQGVVENVLLISAKTSGEYRVLESNSLLCSASRLPIGVVAETLGRVDAPLYTVRFASEFDVRDSGVDKVGTKIYYVPEHSTFVFTQPLKSMKGSDASNFHDEEVGDDEMEFSDDEAEAEHKRQMKLKRRGIDPATVPPPSRGGRGARGQRGRGGRGGNIHMHPIPESDAASAYGTASIEMNYDDAGDGEPEYTPLRRPDVLSQTNPHSAAMTMSGATSPSQYQSHQSFRTRDNQLQSHDSRGSWEGRGRGSFNHHHNRGRGRGSHNANRRNNQHQYANVNVNANTTFPSASSMYSTTDININTNTNDTSRPPPAPYLTPSSGINQYPPGPGQGQGQGSPTIPLPSPMTPLPSSHFPFSFPFGPAQTQPAQQQQQQQGQGPWSHYHANQTAAYQNYQQQTGSYANTNANADAVAQVQRTLAELRRAGFGGGAA